MKIDEFREKVLDIVIQFKSDLEPEEVAYVFLQMGTSSCFHFAPSHIEAMRLILATVYQEMGLEIETKRENENGRNTRKPL